MDFGILYQDLNVNYHPTRSETFKNSTPNLFQYQTVVTDMLKDAMRKEGNKDGFIIVGFPRDIVQAQIFQQKFSVAPVALLLDCSEMELGRNLGQRRGRVDDNKEAVNRRLQLYREATLPMLKSLDEDDRLRVVDGDKEPQKVGCLFDKGRVPKKNEIIFLKKI